MRANVSVEEHPTLPRTFRRMGSRLFPLCLALGATLADITGAHRIAVLLLLVAIPWAAAAAFVAAGDVLDGRPAWVRAVTTGGALVLLVVASAVRHGAPVGAAVPALALSAAIGAAILYLVPVLLWVLQPASSSTSARPREWPGSAARPRAPGSTAGI
jgi:hypothetical protein